MASPFTITPLMGCDLNTPDLAADIAAGGADAPQIGAQVMASNGRRFVYAQANGVIASAAAAVTISVTTFLATSGGGSYLAPTLAASLAAGDRCWFSIASV